MFDNDKSIDNLQQIFAEVKRYLELQKEYAMLDIVEKLIIILSTLISIFVFLTLAMIALLYLSFTFAHLMAPYVGGLQGSYAIITGIIILLIIIVIILRKRLIVQPLTNFLAKLLLKKK